MRHRARSLHILAIAPVAAIVAAVLGLTPQALAASSSAPAPIVITVDPGHGGRSTPTNPGAPSDPGEIGINGLVEKNVDSVVGLRLVALLRATRLEVDVILDETVYP